MEQLQAGSAYHMQAPDIAGYRVVGFQINGGDMVSGDTVELMRIQQNMSIALLYEGNEAGLLTKLPTEETDAIVSMVDACGIIHCVPFGITRDGYCYFLGDANMQYTVKQNDKTFLDTAQHWAREDIAFVAGREVFLGFQNGSFSPDAPVTRAMAVAILYRLAECKAVDAVQDKMFSDVPADAWFAQAVAWAADAGIVNGTGAGMYQPNREITREEFAVMLHRFAMYMGFDIEKTEEVDLTDLEACTPWSRQAVEFVCRADVMHGRGDKRFAPSSTITRAETAAVLHRLIVRVVEDAMEEANMHF